MKQFGWLKGCDVYHQSRGRNCEENWRRKEQSRGGASWQLNHISFILMPLLLFMVHAITQSYCHAHFPKSPSTRSKPDMFLLVANATTGHITLHLYALWSWAKCILCPPSSVSILHVHGGMVDHYPESLGFMHGQQVEYLVRCWVSRPEIPLQISSYSNSTRIWHEYYKQSPTNILNDQIHYKSHTLWHNQTQQPQ